MREKDEEDHGEPCGLLDEKRAIPRENSILSPGLDGPDISPVRLHVDQCDSAYSTQYSGWSDPEN